MCKAILLATVSIAFCLAGGQRQSFAASKETKPLEQEQREVDELVAKVDNVQLRKFSPRVFRLAERLLKEKGDAEAQRYFEKGLKGNSWALEHQLTLGEILARKGQPEALREKAEMVLRIAEDDDVILRAFRILGCPLPETPPPFSVIKEADTVLVLVPVGAESVLTMRDLGQDLSKRLGIKVLIASIEFEIPTADRPAKMQWITLAREQLLKAINDQPALGVRFGEMGFTLEGIKSNDESLVTLIRRMTEQDQGEAAGLRFDEMLAKLDNSIQYDTDKMLPALRRAVTNRAGRRMLVLGVTPFDLFSGSSNFLFGVASTGKHLGIISSARFRAAFNNEAPKRERLTQRLTKQAFSSIGFMLGVPRCTTPECARAYPQSLAEHDQKPSTLCAVCRAGFERTLGKKLPLD